MKYILSLIFRRKTVLWFIFRRKTVLWFIFLLFFFQNALFFPKTTYAFNFNSLPNRIIIPAVKISLPVYLAKIRYDTWEVRTDGASFGEGSALPGGSGNTIIFSHALPHLFGPLVNLKKGDYIHLFTDQDWFVYRVIETLDVDPDNVEIIYAKNNHKLTLYTCVGENYSKRRIVKADIVQVVYK